MSIKVMLWYDVEDYVTPKSDEALLKLIEMMDARGIKGTFKLVGEKARVLRDRERKDILGKLVPHDIGYHTNMHSEHPTMSEYLENYGFGDGAVEFESREEKGFRDVGQITGSASSTYGQPGYSWAPQVFPVLRKWDIPTYVDSIDIISVNEKPFWYGGILNITYHYGTMRMDHHDPDGLQKAKEEFDSICMAYAGEENIIISIFYHPCEFSTTEFWDGVNFSRGYNTPRESWKTSSLRTDEDMQDKVDRLGLFMDYILSKDDVQFITCAQLTELDRADYGLFSKDEVKKLAGRTEDQVYFYCDNRRSLAASETFSLFSSYLLGNKLEPELIYGPEHYTRSEVNGSIAVSDIKKALTREMPSVLGYKQFPDFFDVAGCHINPVDMTCTLARIIREDLKDDDRVELVTGVLRSEIHVSGLTEWGKNWVIHPLELRVPNLVRIAQLQAWTLKPALI